MTLAKLLLPYIPIGAWPGCQRERGLMQELILMNLTAGGFPGSSAK